MIAVKERERRSSIGYLPALDGLRALSVLAVLTFHLETELPLLGEGGGLGVDVFFAISGYLITTILLRQIDRSGSIDLRRFYLNRLIRLWPSLAVVVALMLVPGILVAPSARDWAASSLAAVTYLSPITIGIWDWKVGYQHTWTLGLEEYFYLVFPLLLLGLARLHISRRTAKWMMTIGGLGLLSLTAAARYASSDPNGIFDYLRVGNIALGCALALHLYGRSQPRGGNRWSIIGSLLLLAGLAVAGAGPYNGLSYLLAGVGGCAMILCIVSSAPGPVAGMLSRPSMVYIGVISYELYLWHFPALSVAVWLTGTTEATAALLAYPVTLLAAAATHAALLPVQHRLRERLHARASLDGGLVG
jgi:peptidoglycan/LPS O-acetylase OafA/YrhL